MIKILLKKSISLALAFATLLSLSCCGVGDEALIDETIAQESTSEATETTTNETTEELTTLETTTEEATEATPEETTLTIPDEATILASLTDEEKEVWLSMPDIVTMRLLRRYDEDEEEYYSEFLYTEITYIDKMGQVKKFISYDELNPDNDEETIEWLNDQINHNEDAELFNTANIHTLVKFYNAFMCIESDSTWVPNYTVGVDEDFHRHYWFELYGIRNNDKNCLETLLISDGDAGDYYLRRNNTDEGEPLDKSGSKTFDLYLNIDPFMVKGSGGYGHLAGEEV